MSDFSSGAIVDDDLDLSAARGRKKAREAAGAKAAAWGGKGLNAAIGVSAAMGAMARHFGQDPAYWEAVGYLHDYEQYPEEHLAHTAEPLRQAGVDEESIRAILAHGWTLRNDVEPLTEMEKSLFTVDELTGLVAATARMRPGGLSDLEPSSVKKKFKDKKFAAKINRPLIQKGCDMLGMELTDVMALCIEGMREHMDELGLGPKA